MLKNKSWVNFNTKNKLIFFLLILFLSVTNQNYAVIIIVHGSFSSSSTWHSTQGAFFKKLEKTATIMNQAVVTFNWSGTPTQNEITKAGLMLAKLISSYPKSESITLVGHSHGGNVINIASQHLFDDQTGMLDHIQSMLMDLTTTTKKATCAEHALNTKIDYVYLLGTPIDSQKYAPNTNVIKYLFNFYSKGDNIQSVGGLYGKQYPKHERITNIELKIQDPKTKKEYNPSHSSTHHPFVGVWLLLIPFNLQKAKTGGFQDFALGKNCTIVFKEKDVPTYLANK